MIEAGACRPSGAEASCRAAVPRRDVQWTQVHQFTKTMFRPRPLRTSMEGRGRRGKLKGHGGLRQQWGISRLRLTRGRRGLAVAGLVDVSHPVINGPAHKQLQQHNEQRTGRDGPGLLQGFFRCLSKLPATWHTDKGGIGSSDICMLGVYCTMQLWLVHTSCGHAYRWDRQVYGPPYRKLPEAGVCATWRTQRGCQAHVWSCHASHHFLASARLAVKMMQNGAPRDTSIMSRGAPLRGRGAVTLAVMIGSRMLRRREARAYGLQTR